MINGTVRYGLGRDLVRKAYHREEFVAALGEFLLTYNAENAQVLERYPKTNTPNINIGGCSDGRH
ncbi:MAG: hypothetical protein IPM76_14670 [Chloroflexi bacterium]|nr:hypothetical protein [Chloroflexota bacterium]